MTLTSKYRQMKVKMNDFLKTFLFDSMVFGLVIAIGEYLVSSEINIWKLVLLSTSMGTFSSYAFVTALRRTSQNHEIPPHNNKESKK